MNNGRVTKSSSHESCSVRTTDKMSLHSELFMNTVIRARASIKARRDYLKAQFKIDSTFTCVCQVRGKCRYEARVFVQFEHLMGIAIEAVKAPCKNHRRAVISG